MKNAMVLSRAEMKNVHGGLADGGGEGGGSVTCRYKFKYDTDPDGDWSNWTDWDTLLWGTCQQKCMEYINNAPNVAHCGYDTLDA